MGFKAVGVGKVKFFGPVKYLDALNDFPPSAGLRWWSARPQPVIFLTPAEE